MIGSSPHATMFQVGNIEIADENESPIELMRDFQLFPKASALLWDSLDPKTRLAIGGWCGMHEEIMLRNRSLVAYSATDNSDLNDQQITALLYGLVNELDGLFNTLWIWRDHAASVLPGWSFDAQANRFQRLNFALVTSQCDGMTDVVSVPRAEIEMAAALNRELFPPRRSPKAEQTSEIVHVDQHRLGRALRFVRAARATSGASVKLANYTFAMESLLSWHELRRSWHPRRQSQEREPAKQRIGRIVRSLVSHSPESDQTVTEVVREMFIVRDKLAHGQVLDEKGFSRLSEAVKNADYLLRMVIRALINNEDTRAFICQSQGENKSRRFQEYLDGLGGGPGGKH